VAILFVGMKFAVLYVNASNCHFLDKGYLNE
jgi:hypothetical protein